MEEQAAISDLRIAFRRMGVEGKPVAMHSSLSSFGNLEGGSASLISAALKSFSTVMMPAFSFVFNTEPPLNDRPPCNGTDYSYYDDWSKPLIPFQIESADVDPKMGIVAKEFATYPGVKRSEHAWHSWAASGELAEYLTSNDSWKTANQPLWRLSQRDGYVLLVGVGLSSCTAVHLAEERAGRRPFIRWAINSYGKVERVRAAGCARGFEQVFPYVEDLFSVEFVGKSRMLAAPLSLLIDRVAKILRENPEISRCSEECIRCTDAIKGGPRE